MVKGDYSTLKLKFCCGATGYEELRRQGLPFPGLRTLRRKLEKTLNLKVAFQIKCLSF